MNELLRNLINMRQMESFIDNVLVRIESEEGYDKLVEEVLKRMEVNNLHVKLKTYR